MSESGLKSIRTEESLGKTDNTITLPSSNVIHNMCHRDLRNLAGKSLGMINSEASLSLVKLRNRIKEFEQAEDQNLFRQTHWQWFTEATLIHYNILHKTDVWKYNQPLENKRQDFDSKFESYLTENHQVLFDSFNVNRLNAWKEWEDNGTINLDGHFDYLKEIQTLIDHEYDMYNHHLNHIKDKSKMS